MCVYPSWHLHDKKYSTRNLRKWVTVVRNLCLEFGKEKDSEAGNEPAPLEYNPVYTKTIVHPDETHGNGRDTENAYVGVTEKQGLPSSFYEAEDNPGSDQDDAGSLYDSLAPQPVDPTPHSTPSREAINPLYAGLGQASPRPAQARSTSSSSRWARTSLTDPAAHIFTYENMHKLQQQKHDWSSIIITIFLSLEFVWLLHSCVCPAEMKWQSRLSSKQTKTNQLKFLPRTFEQVYDILYMPCIGPYNKCHALIIVAFIFLYNSHSVEIIQSLSHPNHQHAIKRFSFFFIAI